MRFTAGILQVGVEVSVTGATAGAWTGAGFWTRDGVLQLPYATAEVPCGVAQLTAPSGETGATG